jgi:hypothetical protein
VSTDDKDNNNGSTVSNGSGGFQPPPRNPPIVTFGTRANPMYFQSVPTPKTTTFSPYGNFLDILTRDQKLLWREMVKPSNYHVLLDMNVTNNRAIVNLFQDRTITYCWMHFMRTPTSGTGTISTNPARSPGNKEIYLADLADFNKLLRTSSTSPLNK